MDRIVGARSSRRPPSSPYCGPAEGSQLPVLADATVARFHCLISATPDGFLLRDLSGQGGTTLEWSSACARRCSSRARSSASAARVCASTWSGGGSGIHSRALRFSGWAGAAMRHALRGAPGGSPAPTRRCCSWEAGTRRSLLAEALRAALCARAPFVVVDCSAISPTRIRERALR